MAACRSGCIEVHPCLLVVSGPSLPADALAFSKQDDDGPGTVTSSSGVLLQIGTQCAFALVPAAALRPWAFYKAAHQPCSSCSVSLVLPGSGASLNVLHCDSPDEALPVSVQSAGQALEALLSSVQRAPGGWRFSWAVGSSVAGVSIVEQTSLLLLDATPTAKAAAGCDCGADAGPASSSSAEAGAGARLRALHAALAMHAGRGACCVQSPGQWAPGTPVSVVGSPFGCLAPHHFLNAHVRGVVSQAFSAPAEDDGSPETSACMQHEASGCGCANAAAQSEGACGYQPSAFLLDVQVGGRGRAVVVHEPIPPTPLQPPSSAGLF